jgi:diguanylate cyclase (GGDEF)-like protein
MNRGTKLSGQITEYIEKIIKTSKELGIRVENLTKDQYDLYWSEDAGDFTGDPFSSKEAGRDDPDWKKAKKIAIDLAILNRRSDEDKINTDPDLPAPAESYGSKLFGLIKINTRQSVVVVSLYATILSVLLSVAILYFFSLFQGAELLDLGFLPAIVIPLIIVPPLAYFIFTQTYLVQKMTSEMDTLKRTDALTGLYNKAFFSELVEMELTVASRYSFPSSLFLVDLDHFHEVNDKYGFKVGDHVLQVVATSIRDNLRGSDLVGRFDGEKIMAYLPHTTCEQAMIAAERIRKLVPDIANRLEQEELVLTASIGVCATEFGFDTIDQLIKGANVAVHNAKSGGYDRVEYIAKEQVEQEPTVS